MKLDLIDIAIHVGLALVGMAALMIFPPVAITTIFWPARELIQHRPNYLEIITHPQSLLEWACPVAVGFIIFGVF